MQTALLNELHPHDPQAGFLTRSQAEDMLAYFGPPNPDRRIHFFHGASFDSVYIFDACHVIVAWGTADVEQGRSCYENALRQAQWWPDRLCFPPPLRYVNIGPSVMRGDESICLARSNSTAKRIAAALNWYLPGRRGT